MELPKRKPVRLKNYDYSSNGYYFVTICSYNRKNIFSVIVGQGLAPAEIQLLPYGNIVRQQLLALEGRFDGVRIDNYVIMPNHIHAIVVISKNTAGASPCPTLSDIVCAFKSLSARMCKSISPIEKVFQNSFHDHIIRGEKDYEKIWEYIEFNAQKWKDDCFYNEEKPLYRL